MSDETYDAQRAERLVKMLRELARRILSLDGDEALLREAPQLQRALGDARAELFRYEVRHTYDTPEIADHRRIVGEAGGGWTPDADPKPDEEDGWPPHGR